MNIKYFTLALGLIISSLSLWGNAEGQVFDPIAPVTVLGHYSSTQVNAIFQVNRRVRTGSVSGIFGQSPPGLSFVDSNCVTGVGPCVVNLRYTNVARLTDTPYVSRFRLSLAGGGVLPQELSLTVRWPTPIVHQTEIPNIRIALNQPEHDFAINLKNSTPVADPFPILLERQLVSMVPGGQGRIAISPLDDRSCFKELAKDQVCTLTLRYFVSPEDRAGGPAAGRFALRFSTAGNTAILTQPISFVLNFV
jgi:hypothetical protein